MRVIFFIFFAVCSPVHTVQCPAFEKTCILVEKQYQSLSNDNSSSNQIRYLNSFPIDYKGFVHCFGYKIHNYHKNVSFGCLYDNYVNYINKLFILNKIDKRLLYKKIMTVTYNAYYQDDACGFLQDRILELIKNDKEFVLFLKLDRNKSKQIYHFIMLNKQENIELNAFLSNKILK